MFDFSPNYKDLPDFFYSRVKPQKVPKPGLIAFNHDLAEYLGFETRDLDDETLAQFFCGNTVPDENFSVATVYSGHQFGHFNPQLGDGRAILLGERKAVDGPGFEIQLKGAGRTPYSRQGDGKSPLGPVIREYLVSEAMHHLGVPTTRALAAVTTGESVYREKELPGAVFTRVAPSHIRVGTFEYFASRDDHDSLKTLLKFVVQKNFSDLEGLSKTDELIDAFLNSVIEKQGDLIARWMGLGFIHGVMNTDNCSVVGVTIDYGPCAFMEEFDRQKVFSYIDRSGRYAYARQPEMAAWNLNWLVNCLALLLPFDQGELEKFVHEKMKYFGKCYFTSWLEKFGSKLGIFNPVESDISLIQDFLGYLEAEKKDFTLGFRNLSEQLLADEPLVSNSSYIEFFERWSDRVKKQGESVEKAVALMNQSNPIIIPRNHLVETAIQKATDGDFSFLKEMSEAIKSPYSPSGEHIKFQTPAPESDKVEVTFCGT